MTYGSPVPLFAISAPRGSFYTPCPPLSRAGAATPNGLEISSNNNLDTNITYTFT